MPPSLTTATGRWQFIAIVAGIGAASCVVGLGATAAWLIARAATHPEVFDLMVAIVAVRAFGVGRGVLRYVERLAGHDATLRRLTEVRVGAFRSLTRISPAGTDATYRDLPDGDVAARIVSDVDASADRWLRIVEPYTVAGLVGAAATALIAVLFAPAAVTLGASLLVSALAAPALATVISRRAEAGISARRGRLVDCATQTLHGAADIVAFDAVKSANAQIRAAEAALVSAERRAAAGQGIAAAVTTLAAGAAAWAALSLGTPAVHTGRLSAITLAVIVLAPLAVHDVFATLSTAATQLPRIRAAVARVTEIDHRPDPVRRPARAVPAPEPPYHVQARDLTVRWTPGGPDVFTGVTFTVAAGTRTAIIGPSGSGKSTLAAVLLRLVDPVAGTVRLGGTDIADLDGDVVRRIVGLCAQDAYIFDSTIAENIRLARPDASDAEIRDALGRASLGTWVDTLPDGMDTYVGEHGARLSGGQRQRLALARVLLADFPVLILDEPTEHLDEPTARALMADLLAATSGRTIILITHRPDGLDLVDDVVRLGYGQVPDYATAVD